jgi:hypothetical protein
VTRQEHQKLRLGRPGKSLSTAAQLAEFDLLLQETMPMDKITTWLFFMVFVFVGLGLGVMPGLPMTVTRLSWYVAGWASGAIAGAAMAAAGWVWGTSH